MTMFSCRTLLGPRVRAFIAKRHASHDCHCSRVSERFLSTASQIPRMAENGDPYTTDGKKRVARLMQHDIGLHGELKKANKLRFKNLSVEIASRHILHFSDLNYFTTQGLSYTEAVCRRYLADSAKPLWWRTQALSSTTTAVVRNKATARLNVAFRQALRNAGYDIHGKRLPDQQDGHRSGNKAISRLSGTVVIKAHAPVDIHKMPFEDLQNFCTRVVKGVEGALGQRWEVRTGNVNGLHVNKFKGALATARAGAAETGEAEEASPTRRDRGRQNGLLEGRSHHVGNFKNI